MSRVANSIRLVVADLDGTLIDQDKKITPESHRAIKKMEAAGILFTLVSGRPPFGMRKYVDELGIHLPICGFNGAEITTADFATIRRQTLDSGISREVVQYFDSKKIDYWMYRGSDWITIRSEMPHLAKEATNVGYSASVVPSFEGRMEGLTKIVGISDDTDLIARTEAEMKSVFARKANAARSQPYYLDVTHLHANKETFIDYLSRLYSIPRQQIATIGDMPSDVFMFKGSGLSIAMGNAFDSVKSEADQVTAANSEDGFARAMESYVLKAA
jgi:Cof subfamily protein (haloacid dehalogenase superfamily)